MKQQLLIKTIFVMGLLITIVFASALAYTLSTSEITETRTQKGQVKFEVPKIEIGLRGPMGPMGLPGCMGPQGPQGPKGLSTPEFDSGWIDISDKAGQQIDVTHDLNCVDIIAQITGKTAADGQAHQKYYGLVNSISGWSKTYGGLKDDQGYAIAKTEDDGYIVGIETTSFGAGNWDIMLLKIDANGNQQWNKTYGGAATDYVNYVIQTADGGYLTAGPTNSSTSGDFDVGLMKTDSHGNVVWSKTYGTTQNDYAFCVTPTKDGGYIAAGSNSTGLLGSFPVSAELVKVDANGNLQWLKTYSSINDAASFNVVQTGDEGFAFSLAGLFGAGEHDYGLAKVDSQGNLQWLKSYGGAATDICRSMIKTSDGGYALAGLTNSFGNGQYDVWLVKVDANGVAQWNQTYGGKGDDRLFAYSGLLQTSGGGYAMAAATTTYGSGNRDYWFIKTDSYGNMQYSKTYGGTGGDTQYSMVQASDGSFVIAGLSTSFGNSYEVYVVKTSADGEAGLAWIDSTADSLTLYRGANDVNWNYVRVQVWKIK